MHSFSLLIFLSTFIRTPTLALYFVLVFDWHQGAGILHRVSVGNSLRILRVTVSGGKCTSIHHATRRWRFFFFFPQHVCCLLLESLLDCSHNPMTLDAFLMEDVGNIWSWHWKKSVWKIDNVALFVFSQMTLCPITSPRVRGERDPGYSSCSPSSRRQCCPADRKCTEQHRLGVKPWGVWDLFVCMC